jgi:hypothetical protein
MKDVQLYYYDCIFTLKGGDELDLEFESEDFETITNLNEFGVESKGSWSVSCNEYKEIEIRDIDLSLMNDHEQKIIIIMEELE